MRLVQSVTFIRIAIAWVPQQPLCCVRPEKFTVQRVGNGKWPIYVIDDVLCPNMLRLLQSTYAVHQTDFGVENDNAFPGVVASASDLAAWSEPGSESQDLYFRIAAGEHLTCLVEAFDQLLDHPAPFNQQHVDHLLRDAAEANDTLGIARFSALSRRPKLSTIHTDEGSYVINIHILPGNEDTGTSFWRTKLYPKGTSMPVEYCGDMDGEALAVEGPAVQKHCARTARATLQRLSKLRKAGEGPPPPFDTDATGMWEKYHHVFTKVNRAIIYNGDLPHAAYISPESFDRIEKGLTTRLMLSSFVEVSPQDDGHDLEDEGSR